MRKLIYVSGAITSSLFVLGMLFKIFHWPGAGPLLLVGMTGFALIFIPSFAVYHYKKEK